MNQFNNSYNNNDNNDNSLLLVSNILIYILISISIIVGIIGIIYVCKYYIQKRKKQRLINLNYYDDKNDLYTL